MQERFALCNVALSEEDVAQTKMLILVVEDEPICALSTVAELEHAGHTTLGPAATLEEGFELARTGHPTLALIDIDLMRAGDGFELARRLRELNIAAVFVSLCKQVPVRLGAAIASQTRSKRRSRALQ